jgi:hypothetical protein
MPEPNEIRKQYGLEISPYTLEVNGRIIDEPQIFGRSNSLFKKDRMEIRNGKVNYRDSPISSPFRFDRNNWIVMCNDRNIQDAQKMISSFKICVTGIGVFLEDPKIISHKCRDCQEYLDEIDKIKNLKDYSIIVFILSWNEKQYYKYIKNKVMSQYCIPSQVLLKENLNKKKLSYFTNVLLQMNYKIGGELFKISNLHKFIRDKVHNY